jgi:hypothetical protein
MAPDRQLFGSKNDKIGAKRPALSSRNHPKKDFSAGSPVVNEVVLVGVRLLKKSVLGRLTVSDWARNAQTGRF